MRGIHVVALALASPLLALVPASGASAQPVRAELRVNQQGWLPRETKLAALMTSGPIGATRFTVVNDGGEVVLRGTVPSR